VEKVFCEEILEVIMGFGKIYLSEKMEKS